MIREMHNEDMKRVTEIWLEDSIRIHNFFPGAEDYWRERLPYFLVETRGAIGYVCEAGRAVNGFITMRPTDHYVYALYVDFYLRGHRIGRDLLDKAKSLAERLPLHVYRKDKDAICFYIKQDFVIVFDPDSGPEEETGEFKYHMEWRKDNSTG